MRRGVTMVVLVMGSLLWPLWARAGQPCEVVPMPCTFEALAFQFKVIDAEGGQPLADVHALAEWQMEGAGGGLDGPLMVLDAVSGPDGMLSFPGWGPIQGPVTGIGIGRDPVITLFKPEYKALVINNGDPPGTKETQRVRRFYQSGRTYPLQPFRGTPDQWLEQLHRVWLGVAVPRDDQDSLQFRNPYLNRLRRISPERQKFPLDQRRFEGFFWHVDRELKLLEEGHR
jgi:hypothetical protein